MELHTDVPGPSGSSNARVDTPGQELQELTQLWDPLCVHVQSVEGKSRVISVSQSSHKFTKLGHPQDAKERAHLGLTKQKCTHASVV